MNTNQMTVRELIEILSIYDEDLPVEIEAYGESSQGHYSDEVDIGIEDGVVVITPGNEI